MNVKYVHSCVLRETFHGDCISYLHILHTLDRRCSTLIESNCQNKEGHLGFVRFDAFVSSGLHQHQAVATSFILQGGLSDYHGSVRLHQVGINLRGATHDAIAYENTVLVSRLEGPVIYPQSDSISGVHSGSRHQDFVNPAPEVPPEINITVDELPQRQTGFEGVSRQDIFDYQGTGSNSRMCQLSVLPKTEFTFKTSKLVELWVRGGQCKLNDQMATANSFVQCAPEANIRITSDFGALLIVWAEGAEQQGSATTNLFGF